MYASFRVSDFYQTYLYYPCKLRGYLTTFFGHEKTGFTLELCYSESTDPVAVCLSDLNAGYMMYPLIQDETRGPRGGHGYGWLPNMTITRGDAEFPTTFLSGV